MCFKSGTLAILALACAIPTAGATSLAGLAHQWNFDDPDNLGAPTVGGVTLNSHNGPTAGGGAGPLSPSSLDTSSGGILRVGAEGSLDLAGDFSYSLWARQTGGGQWLKMFAHNTSPGGSFAQAEIDNQGGMVWNVRVSGNNSEVHTAPFLGDGNWHHLALYREGGTVGGYIDGAPITLGNFGEQQNLGAGEQLTGTTGFAIGAEVNASNHFRGLIDDFRIYNRALSEADAAQLFSEGPGFVVPEPTSSVLAVVGLLSLGLVRRRRRD